VTARQQRTTTLDLKTTTKTLDIHSSARRQNANAYLVSLSQISFPSIISVTVLHSTTNNDLLNDVNFKLNESLPDWWSLNNVFADY